MGAFEGAHACGQSGRAAPEGKQPRTGEGLSGFRERKSSRQGWPEWESSKPSKRQAGAEGALLGLGIGVHSLHSLTVKGEH